jgi:hypothetical protein
VTAPRSRQAAAARPGVVVDLELKRHEHDVPRGRSIMALVVSLVVLMVFASGLALIVVNALSWAAVRP